MIFTIIDPSVIDVYVAATQLNILQDKLEKVGPDGVTEDIKNEVDKAASEYVISVNVSEKILGCRSNIQAQIDILKLSRLGIS